MRQILSCYKINCFLTRCYFLLKKFANDFGWRAGALGAGEPESWAPELGPETGAIGTGGYGPEAEKRPDVGGGIEADEGGIGGSELVEVESEDRSWWRWNRRIGAGGGGIEADGGGIGGSELMEMESEDRS
ncbi:hypothetical protein B9Z55_010930 [Caenorhabditis nigoni]|uniref:Uncharacterized protein n=1 Tax=Caenorhabditis nigoni TaxID=1611254 RepID=A0A2G5UHX7_9PELO|nr:hypothetical protein B9Z55_010930 [Caenorhabditis nigoni]